MSSRDADRRLAEKEAVRGLTADYQALFDASPTPLLVIAPPHWTIIAANDARLRVTGTYRDEQIGLRLFDVFPDDPDDPSADGERNLTASLERVVATKSVDTMAVQRYAVRGPHGRFVERWWAPTNTPVFGKNGEVELIMHHVEDVTEVVRLRGDAKESHQLSRAQQVVIDRLRASEAALHESETRRDAALNIARLGTFEWILASGTVVLDARSREIFGFTIDEPLTAERVFDRIHPEDLSRAMAASDEAAIAIEHLAIDYRIRLPDGATRTLSSLSGPVLGSDGTTERMIGVFADVTERNRAEVALRESEMRFRAMADNAPVMMWVTDPRGYCTYLNARWYEFTEQTPTSGEGYGWLDAVHPEDRSMAEAAFVSANAERRNYRIDFRLRRADGVYRWAIDAAAARFDETGEFLGYVGSVIDIDERREAEERLALSEEQLRLALEVAEIGQWDVDQATGAMFWPPRVKEMFGISPDVPVTLENFHNGVHPEDQKQTRTAYEAASDPDLRALYDVEYRTVGKEDGVVRWVAAKGRGLFTPEGVCHRVIGTAIDITARKANEVRLRELNERLEQEVTQRTAERNRVWEMSCDLFAVMGFDGHLKAINPAWETTLGRSIETLLSLSFREQVHPDDHQAVQTAMERLLRGETVDRFVDRLRHADGSWRWISWTLVPEGEVFYAVGRDVTPEKEAAAELALAQEALRQSQKMEAMGQLTGGVAHDFNNLLTPIIGGLDMLQRRGLGDDRARRQIDGALQSAERAKTLVQRLLAFARRQPLQPTAVDVGDLVEGMTDLIGSTIGPAIEIHIERADALPPARADANQLEMALLNLAVNARDAMPGGGTLTIALSSECVSVDHEPALSPGDYLRLCVADTGNGMDEETRKRAVEPFFSTKGIGRGTGLGLSMVHGLTAQLGGGLLVKSALGQGTMVELWLPVSANATAREKTPEPAPAVPGVGKILLVDDEVLVRMGTADMLEDLGYEVVHASSAEDALRQLSEGLKPDILLTDHLMPGMNGGELINIMRADRPSIPMVIVSGYSEVEGIPAGIPRLSKPFRHAELAECLASLNL